MKKCWNPAIRGPVLKMLCYLHEKNLPSDYPCFDRVIFQNKSVGEFWYDIALTATTPPPRELPLMQCPLGR